MSDFNKLLRARLDDPELPTAGRAALKFAQALRTVEEMVGPSTGTLTDGALAKVSERAVAANSGSNLARFQFDEAHLLLGLLAAELEQRRQAEPSTHGP